jgi:hypothetical protein
MIHLTLTGYDAGRTLGAAPRTEGDTYWHAMYCSPKQLSSPEVCTVCVAMWNDDTKDNN